VFDGPTEEGIDRYLKAIPPRLDLREAKLANRLHRASGAVRITDLACFDETGRQAWQVRSGGTLTLRIGFEAIETVPDLVSLLRLRSATTGESITAIREIVSASSVEAGRSGTIELVFPTFPLRPGEFSFYLWLGRSDDRIAYDVIDENVDLPFLRVLSDSFDYYEREGTISLQHRFSVINETASLNLQGVRLV